MVFVFPFLVSLLNFTRDNIFLILPGANFQIWKLGVFSVLNLQDFVTRVKRLEIPNVIDAFSCLEDIINTDEDKPRRNCYISFATHANSFFDVKFK